MWRRRLYHRCEELFKEKISERGRRRRGRKRRRKWIRGWSKAGSRNPADFRAFSLSLPFLPFPTPLSFSQLSSQLGIFVHPMGNRPKRGWPKQVFKDQRVSKENCFEWPWQRNEAIGHDTRYSNENTVH